MNLMPICSLPLWQSKYEDFEEHKEIFLKSVKNYKEKNPSIKKSNNLGYRSPESLQSVEELYPVFEYICQMGFKALSDLNFIDCDIVITSALNNALNDADK